MHSSIQLALIFLAVLLVAGWMFFRWAPAPGLAANDPRRVEVSNALSKMKRLWTERSYLARMANVESIANYNGASLTNQKLAENGEQLSRNLANLYSPEAGDALNNLLGEYHQQMHSLMVKARQHKDINDDFAQFKAQGHQLAAFFHHVCPCLDQEKLKTLIDSNADSFLKSTIRTVREEGPASMASFSAYVKSSQDLCNYLDEHIWCHLIGDGPRHP